MENGLLPIFEMTCRGFESSMNSCTECHLCEKPGSYAGAIEKRTIPSNVRHFSNESFTVWRCTGCGSLHSLESADLPRFYADYPFKDHKLNFHMRCAYKKRIALLRQAGVATTSSILDFGCGAGIYVDFLRQNGFSDVRGYDPFIPEFSDQRAIERTFDVVVSHDVIEHVDDPIAFLDAMVGLVAPGGLLVIGTPNASELPLNFAGVASPELSQPYHRHIFSDQALIDLARRRGFAVRGIYRRFYFDTLVPTVNARFMWKYIELKGGYIDAAVEPPDTKFILSSPTLLWSAFFGYFHRMPGNMLLTFHKPFATVSTHPAALSEQSIVANG